jgi:hypothetical protein
VTNNKFLELAGAEFADIICDHDGDLRFNNLRDAIQACLEWKSVDLDEIDGKAVTVLYAYDQYFILESDAAICRIIASDSDIDASCDWDHFPLKKLPKGTIGRWLHPEIESELWRLEAIAETERKEQQAEREKADRLAQFERLKAEFDA